MSSIDIVVRLEGYGLQIPRTTVYVEGEFAYQSGNSPDIEVEQLKKLCNLLVKYDVESYGIDVKVIK